MVAILMLFRPSGPCCLSIREFLVAILMLFRPSGPCCLSVAEAPFLSLEIPIRELSFEQKEQQEQEQQQQKEKVTKK